MIGITRIIKHELFKQDALPDKWNDYEVGNIYTLNGEILDVPSDLNLCDTDVNTFDQPMFLIPEELPTNVPWEISLKWAFYGSPGGSYQNILAITGGASVPNASYVVRMDNVKANFGNYATPSSFFNGVPNYALREFECKVYYNPETKRMEYQISSNNKSQTGYWKSTPSTIRPAIAKASDIKASGELYLRDFKFTYNGKSLFDRN